jgi:predicted dehydrogenase
VAQRPRDGSIEVTEVPEPVLRPRHVLVANRFSLISAGTERTKVEFGEKGLLAKARARPDLVRKVVDRARTEGIRAAFSVARERLDELAALGYSSAGVVLRLGEGVEGLAPGDPVSCAGGGFANHAEVVSVPRNLVAKVPDGVGLEEAAYATVGAIALHAVRRAGSEIGERVGVVGLGLVGQLAARIVDASGGEPVGFDPDEAARELARASGVVAFDPNDLSLESAVASLTGGLGLDAVLVCASSRSADPVELAVRVSRDRGRVVIVGDVPVSADRRLLYEKELDVVLSRSYGPGRYDRDYEERGRDFPPGYVRWTEGRNLAAFLELVAAGRLEPVQLTTHRFPVDQAEEAYAVLRERGDRRPFGIVLEYPAPEERPAPIKSRPVRGSAGEPRIGLIGAGAYARSVLIPALRKENATLAAVASGDGLAAADAAARLGFEAAATGAAILDDDAIDAVVIATRHSSHAGLAAEALRRGKSVLVEKPLALNAEELDDVVGAVGAGGVLMVGFNRRFAPLTERLRSALSGLSRRVVSIRVNAGPLADDHWLLDPEEGGGRLLGEACHFVDLLAHLAESRIARVQVCAIPEAERPLEATDSAAAMVTFADGGIGSLVYTGAGDVTLPKEQVEVFVGGVAAVLDDFRRLDVYGGGRRSTIKQRQDKGHVAEVARFLAGVRGVVEPPPVESYLDSSRATLALMHSLRTGLPADLL